MTLAPQEHEDFMDEVPPIPPPNQKARTLGHRLVGVIIFETVAVLIVGLLVLGITAEMGYYRAGLIAAVVIWVGVSPAIEIATVLRMEDDDLTDNCR